MNAIYIAQDYAQVDRAHGAEMTEILETLCAYKIIFPQNNFKTAQRTAELIGKYTDMRESQSEAVGAGVFDNRKNVSTSEEGLHLVTAQDILNLQKGEIIIIAEGFARHPIKCFASHVPTTKALNKLWIKRNE